MLRRNKSPYWDHETPSYPAATQLQALIPISVGKLGFLLVGKFGFLDGVHYYGVIFVCQGDDFAILDGHHLRLLQYLFYWDRQSSVNQIGDNLAIWRKRIRQLLETAGPHQQGNSPIGISFPWKPSGYATFGVSGWVKYLSRSS